MAKSPYVIDPHLTGVAIAYKNPEYIADEIAPYRTVNKEEFQWDEYTLAEMFTIPDTKVGRLSAPNQVTFSSTRITDSTEDYGLDAPVPQKDIENADPHQDPEGVATEGVMELIKLDREKRLADQVFSLNSYLSTQRATLSGTSQFSNVASRPIDVIGDALDAMMFRANTLVFGQAAWTAFRRHPQIVESIRGTGAQQGMVSREQVAELYEIDRVIVGKGWVNTARPGQATNFVRLWGKHVAMLHINPSASLTSGVQLPTWMLTARFGTPTSGRIPDPDMGLDGGVRIRAGEKVKEVRISQHCGYFFQNAVA